MAAKIKKGDKVMVLTGRDKGRSGQVLQVMPKDERAVVQGINLVKKPHSGRAQQSGRPGSSRKRRPSTCRTSPHIDSDGKPTRVGFKILEDGRKVRFAKRSGDIDRWLTPRRARTRQGRQERRAEGYRRQEGFEVGPDREDQARGAPTYKTASADSARRCRMDYTAAPA